MQPGTAQKLEGSTSGCMSAPKEKAGTSLVENPTTQQRCQSAEDLEKAQDAEVISGSQDSIRNRANTTL